MQDWRKRIENSTDGLAEKIAPKVKAIKEALGAWMFGTKEEAAAGKAALAKMFTDAFAVVKPYMQEWGATIGAAIWRGFKDASLNLLGGGGKDPNSRRGIVGKYIYEQTSMENAGYRKAQGRQFEAQLQSDYAAARLRHFNSVTAGMPSAQPSLQEVRVVNLDEITGPRKR